MKRIILYLLFVVCTNILTAQTIKYVTSAGSGTKDGTSWANACDGTQIQSVLNSAYVSGKKTELWIAAGTYNPTLNASGLVPSNAQDKIFSIRGNVTVYGGFQGIETSPSQRKRTHVYSNPQVYDSCQFDSQTIFSAEIGAPGTSDNCYQVASVSSATVDGIILSDGYNTFNSSSYGAGANISSGVIRNCIIKNGHTVNGGAISMTGGIVEYCSLENNSGNNGAAIAMFGGKVQNCYFFNNIASYRGGGIYSMAGTITNNVVVTNTALFGGGIYIDGQVSASNNKIINNKATGSGGGVYFYIYGTFANNIVTNNQASSSGAGIYCESGGSILNSIITNNKCLSTTGGIFLKDGGTLINCIIWNNQNSTTFGQISTSGTGMNVTYSAIQDNFSGTGNLNLNQSNITFSGTSGPFFKNPYSTIGNIVNDESNLIKADWSTLINSPVLNSGTPDTLGLKIPLKDFVGKPRISQNRIDMGAYEFRNLLLVTKAGAGYQDGSTWENAMPAIGLQDAISQISASGFNGDIWVAADTLYSADLLANPYSVTRNTTLWLKSNVNVYGSFNGTEESIENRIRLDLNNDGFIDAWEWKNKTVLSGKINPKYGNLNKVFHVVTFQSSIADSTAILDGFEISGGDASYANQAQIHADSIGGGLYMENGVVLNCIITDNSAYTGGAADIVGKGTIDKSYIFGNTSTEGTINMTVKGCLLNSIVANNYGLSYRSGVTIYNGSSVLNCIIAKNTTFSLSNLTALDISDGATVTNSVIWGHQGLPFQSNQLKVVMSYTALGGTYVAPEAGTGTFAISNNNDGPQFIAPTSFSGLPTNASQWNEVQLASWHVQNTSALINAGPIDITNLKCGLVDVAGNTRIENGRIDIGPFEHKIIKPFQVKGISIADATEGSVTVSWTRGNGDGVSVFVKQATGGDNLPINGNSYKGNVLFGSGDQIESSGWYCAYSGSGSQTTITNLNPGSWYKISVFEWNGNNYRFYSDTLVVNRNTKAYLARQNQTISFTNLPTITYGASDFVADAYTTSSLPLDYTSSDFKVATIVNGRIHIVGIGTCIITANQNLGDSRYYPALPQSQTLTVLPAQLKVVATNVSKTYGDGNPTLTFSYVGFVNNDDSTSLSPYPFVTCNADNYSNVGDYTITVKGGYSDNYVLSYVNAKLIINKAILSVTVPDSEKVYGSKNPILAISYSGFKNNDNVSNAFSVIPKYYCSANQLSPVGAYPIILSGGVSQNYTFDYSSAQLNIIPANQLISFGSISQKKFGDPDFDPKATASSGETVDLQSDNLSVASIVDGKIHIVGVGSANIIASQAGTLNYNVAQSVTQPLIISKALQTITFDPLAIKTFGDADFTLDAYSSSSLPISYSSDNASVANVTGNVVTIVGAGKVNIKAEQNGDGYYEAAKVIIRQLSVLKADQTIHFDTLPTVTFGNVQTINPVVSSDSKLPISLMSSNASVARIVNGNLVIVGAGDATISAMQAGNSNYNQAFTTDQPLSVIARKQHITTSIIDSITFSQVDIALGLKTDLGLSLSLISETPNSVQIVNNSIHTVGTGVATLRLYQSGTTGIEAFDSTIQIVVKKAPQTISFMAIATKKIGSIPFKVYATSSSGFPVQYSSSNPLIAEVVDNEITINGSGVCVITASVQQSDNYWAASTTQQLLVTALNTLKMPMYTINRDTILNLNDLIIGNDAFTFTFVSGKSATANVQGSMANIVLNKSNKAWIGTDTLWFTATNNSVAGDVQTLGIKIRRIPLVEEIGMVTVDSTTGTKCIVAWERSVNAGIKGYIMYRGGNVAGKWDSIGYVSANARSLFVDANVNVKKQAFQYRMVTVDSNNVRSLPSASHTTMHLMSGVNLQNQPQLWWTPYVGADVESYIIYRKNQTTGELDSIGSSILTSYTDIDAPVGSVGYRVAIRFAIDINPDNLKSDSGPFSQSLSNMAESELTESNVNEQDNISVYPNPANTTIYISKVQNAQVSIINDLGKVIVEPKDFKNEKQVKIAIENIPAGLYFVKIIINDSVKTTQFIKE
jgi:hypothetical protein